MAGTFLGAILNFYFAGNFDSNFEPQAKIRICTFIFFQGRYVRFVGEVDAQRESKTLCIGCRGLSGAYSDGL